MAAAAQVGDEQQRCELEGQQRQVRTSLAQVQNQLCTSQCCMQTEMPMDTSQIVQQQKTNVTLSNDDEMPTATRTLVSHPPPLTKSKSKKKNNASRFVVFLFGIFLYC